MQNNVFVNSIPHTGTHLVTVILELLGYDHAVFRHRFYCIEPYYRRWQKAGINWRTASELGNFLNVFDRRYLAVSVASPRRVKVSVIANLLSKVGEGQYVIGHVPYSNEAQTVVDQNIAKTITVIRDPRDMALSMLSHVETRPRHHAHSYLFGELSDSSDRFKAVILGYSNEYGHLAGISTMYNSMLKWENDKNNITVKFEDLVGEKGGGDSDSQLSTIRLIIEHLGLLTEISEARIAEIGKQSFGGSDTFRKGKLGRWREALLGHDKDLCKASINKLLVELDYENDNSW